MAILYGTTGDGTTLPVLVDQFGNLLAKGINGEQGPPGPEGPPGVGELPPGATDGALLGWQDGELVWVTEPLPPVYVPGFVPVIYTGNGTVQSISTEFSPDLVWFKCRDQNYNHALTDSVTGPNKRLSSDTNGAQASDNSVLTAFTADGFTIGGGFEVNASNFGYVAWCWDAGDTFVTNNDGNIPSQVKSNGSFSVVTWRSLGSDGDYISMGHGLNSSPGLVITKSTNIADDWYVAHGYDLTAASKLNKPGDFSFVGDAWGDGITSSVIGMRIGSFTANDYMQVAYCWAETPGSSSFGQYDGNGGRQTITTGFRPSLVIIKSTVSGNWFMFDNARGASNALYANLPDTEADTGVIEFLDDGFQLLFALPGVNQSNETYIYAAFANPSDAAFAQQQLRRQARQEERQQNETRPR